jgi:hypothetical protein
VTVGGIAWDAGYGINAVEVSSNGGKTWAAAPPSSVMKVSVR